MPKITNDGLNHSHTVCSAAFYRECPEVKNYKRRLKPILYFGCRIGFCCRRTSHNAELSRRSTERQRSKQRCNFARFRVEFCCVQTVCSRSNYLMFFVTEYNDKVRAAVSSLLRDEADHNHTSTFTCRNCGTSSSLDICFDCLQRQQCTHCRRYLPEHCFVSHALCRACEKKNNKPRPTIKTH